MKKIVLFFAFAFASVFSYGQSDREFLKLGISFANAQLPIVNECCTVERMELVDDDIVMYITLDETQGAIDEYAESFQQNKSLAISMTFHEGDGVASLMGEYGVGLRYVITGSLSGKVLEVPLSYEELMDAMSAPIETDALLDQLVSDAKRSMPMDLGMGMKITDVCVEGNYLKYKVVLDESVVTLSLLEMMKTEYINGVVSYMKTVEDPAERALCKCMIDGNVGIKYVFMSESSSKTVTITITPEMLK
jgi:hypothetical protein